MFRKLAAAGVPTTTFVLGAVAVQAGGGPDVKQDKDEFGHYKCKPSELPLYAPLHSFNTPKRSPHPPKDSALRTTIEGGVCAVRTEIQAGYKVMEKQKDAVNNYIQTAKAHTESTIDYLNQPHNLMPRTGAIAIGGLSGFIFAARGGFIKKVIYTTIGAGAVASLCYPRQAEQFAKEALFEARKGYAIAYNFVKGVKPGEEVPVEPISKFPTTLEDVKFMALDLFDEAKEALFPKKK
ncbi:MICOS complex subunit MIC27 [Stomoxys calcitrans]|uniref:MICOS complex subunit n=1 Tax=Stomoxys calcitrans TaxID=35570 RepID=A0A1I8PU57_STOCA|nr:MICOS complex subunit MIC27 [Stomoxys calcitrans]